MTLNAAEMKVNNMVVLFQNQLHLPLKKSVKLSFSFTKRWIESPVRVIFQINLLIHNAIYQLKLVLIHLK